MFFFLISNDQVCTRTVGLKDKFNIISKQNKTKQNCIINHNLEYSKRSNSKRQYKVTEQETKGNVTLQKREIHSIFLSYLLLFLQDELFGWHWLWQ